MATLRAPGGTGTAGEPGHVGAPVLAPVGGLPTAGGGITGARSLRRMARAITANRKATTGAVLLLLFCFVGLFPGLIAHDSPTAEFAGARSLGPSAQHLLGTTAFGQDMFAQVIYGARPVLLIAFGVGLLVLCVQLFRSRRASTRRPTCRRHDERKRTRQP